jgi:hypothetical protein
VRVILLAANPHGPACVLRQLRDLRARH